MLLQHKLLGAALLAVAVTLSACSDGDGGITAQRPAIGRSRRGPAFRGEQRDESRHASSVGAGSADLPAGRAVRRRPGRSERRGTDLHRPPSLSERLCPSATHSPERRARHRASRAPSSSEWVRTSRGATSAPLPVDGFVTAKANMAHFASARGITEVQVHAIGPFQLTYVHPEDDPTTKK